MLTVLVVEDDPAHARLFEEYLKATGWQTIIASNGKQALECAFTPEFDAVVLDILLPDIDGRKIIADLRRMPALTKTPIIAVSALADHFAYRNCIAAGADAFLPKPITLAVLGRCLTDLTKSAIH